MQSDELSNLPTKTKIRLEGCPSIFMLVAKDHFFRWIVVEHSNGKAVQTAILQCLPEKCSVVS